MIRCPHCAEHNATVRKSPFGGYAVECFQCRATSPRRDTPEQATADWHKLDRAMTLLGAWRDELARIVHTYHVCDGTAYAIEKMAEQNRDIVR